VFLDSPLRHLRAVDGSLHKISMRHGESLRHNSKDFDQGQWPKFAEGGLSLVNL
jgi:hypothetical protein